MSGDHAGRPSVRLLSLLAKRPLAALPVLLAFSACLPGQETPWAQLVERGRPAVVVIETDKGSGSGFFVKPDGTLVTTHRVVESGELKAVRLASGEVYRRAYVLTSDKSKDLAIVRVEAFDVPVLPLGNSNQAKVGDEVLLLGPGGGPAEAVSTGQITRIEVLPAGMRAIQTSLAPPPGSSGAPVLNALGEVIAVCASQERAAPDSTIPVNYVRGLLEALPLAAGGSPPKEEAGKPEAGSKATASAAEQVPRPKRPGILFAGYAQNQKYYKFFEYIYVELMNHLTAGGIVLANKPGEVQSLSSDPMALNELLDRLPEMGASGLVFLRVDTNEVGWHWLTLECFDERGVRAWQEKTNSLWSGAMTPSGCARAALNRMADKLKRHLGKPCLPTRAQSLPASAPPTAPKR